MPDPSGWMPGVEHIPAQEWGYPDIAEDGMYPQGVINHVMQGFRRTMDDWARSAQPEGKSATFGVDRVGNIAQYVSIWNPAYHAGGVNTPDSWGQTMLDRYGLNPNKWSDGIEQEGFSQEVWINGRQIHDYVYGPANPWPEPMVQSVIAIHQFIFNSCQWILDDPRKQDRVLTHSQFDTRTRINDPGQLWIDTVKPRIVAALIGAAPAPLEPSGDAVARELIRDAIVLLGRAEVAIK